MPLWSVIIFVYYSAWLANMLIFGWEFFLICAHEWYWSPVFVSVSFGVDGTLVLLNGLGSCGWDCTDLFDCYTDGLRWEPLKGFNQRCKSQGRNRQRDKETWRWLALARWAMVLPGVVRRSERQRAAPSWRSGAGTAGFGGCWIWLWAGVKAERLFPCDYFPGLTHKQRI